MIGRGDKFEDLYILDTDTLKFASTIFVSNVSAHVWHNRLGHLSFKRLDALKNHLHCDVSRLNKAFPCYIFPLAKQRRLSFDSHNHMSQFPMIWCIVTLGGLTLFLHMLDINIFQL